MTTPALRLSADLTSLVPADVPQDAPRPGDDLELTPLCCAPLTSLAHAHPGMDRPAFCPEDVPGAVFAGQDAERERWLCGGFVPCESCPPCRGGAPLACQRPLIPGANRPGALAQRVVLPRSGLAPLSELPAATDLAEVVGLVAAVGPLFQATALAGMTPGDTVLVLGPTGPGQLALALLRALGLRPAVPTDGPQRHTDAPLPEGVERWTEGEDPAPAASPRVHLLDLAPSPASLAAWVGIAARCHSATLVGPAAGRLLSGAAVELSRLLAGQVALRWCRAIHPHLLLDLVSLVLHGRLNPPIQRLSRDPEVLGELFRRFLGPKAGAEPGGKWENSAKNGRSEGPPPPEDRIPVVVFD